MKQGKVWLVGAGPGDKMCIRDSLRTIWIFNSFDLIVIITGGGPVNYSQTLPSYMYSKAFASYDFGLASAFGVLLIVILGIYAVLFLKLSNYDKAGDF